jgi:hypothetical protein
VGNNAFREQEGYRSSYTDTPHATVEPLFTKRLLADQTEAYNYSSIVFFSIIKKQARARSVHVSRTARKKLMKEHLFFERKR